MTRTLLTSGVPHHLWVEAVLTSVYLINLLPTPVLNWDTPHTRLYGSPPYSSLRVFGSACCPHLGPYVSNKLSSCSLECVFLGYNPYHKGYHCLDPTTGRVYVSRHVLFNESLFPYKNLRVHSAQDSSSLEFTLLSSPGIIHSQPTSFGPGPNEEQPTPSMAIAHPASVYHSELCQQREVLEHQPLSAPLPDLATTTALVITYRRRQPSAQILE